MPPKIKVEIPQAVVDAGKQVLEDAVSAAGDSLLEDLESFAERFLGRVKKARTRVKKKRRAVAED